MEIKENTHLFIQPSNTSEDVDLRITRETSSGDNTEIIRWTMTPHQVLRHIHYLSMTVANYMPDKSYIQNNAVVEGTVYTQENAVFATSVSDDKGSPADMSSEERADKEARKIEEVASVIMGERIYAPEIVIDSLPAEAIAAGMPPYSDVERTAYPVTLRHLDRFKDKSITVHSDLKPGEWDAVPYIRFKKRYYYAVSQNANYGMVISEFVPDTYIHVKKVKTADKSYYYSGTLVKPVGTKSDEPVDIKAWQKLVLTLRVDGDPAGRRSIERTVYTKMSDKKRMEHQYLVNTDGTIYVRDPEDTFLFTEQRYWNSGVRPERYLEIARHRQHTHGREFYVLLERGPLVPDWDAFTEDKAIPKEKQAEIAIDAAVKLGVDVGDAWLSGDVLAHDETVSSVRFPDDQPAALELYTSIEKVGEIYSSPPEGGWSTMHVINYAGKQWERETDQSLVFVEKEEMPKRLTWLIAAGEMPYFEINSEGRWEAKYVKKQEEEQPKFISFDCYAMNGEKRWTYSRVPYFLHQTKHVRVGNDFFRFTSPTTPLAGGGVFATCEQFDADYEPEKYLMITGQGADLKFELINNEDYIKRNGRIPTKRAPAENLNRLPNESEANHQARLALYIQGRNQKAPAKTDGFKTSVYLRNGDKTALDAVVKLPKWGGPTEVDKTIRYGGIFYTYQKIGKPPNKRTNREIYLKAGHQEGHEKFIDIGDDLVAVLIDNSSKRRRGK